MKKGVKHFDWKGTHLKLMRENAHLTDAQLAKLIGTNPGRLSQFRQRAGIPKAKDTKFGKGNTPHNKGKAAAWAKESEGCRKGQFRRGGRPHNANAPGTIRVEYEHGKPRLMICVEGGRSKPYARHLWESTHGPVPQGHIVRIVNGDPMDVRLDNIQCIPRAELARMNLSKIDRNASGLKAWSTRRTKAKVRAYTDHKPYPLAA